ncbi:MAG: hypothetical protein IKC59_04550 [Clostridia bacterium]|nr:hypothetical protein [Clostridia bacterium]
MKHTKRLTSALLATIMVLSMLIPAAVLPTTAETTDDLSLHLYVHYTFDAIGSDGYIHDVAPTSDVNTVDDKLDMGGSSIPNEQWKIASNFEISDSVISPIDRRAALIASSSADLQAIQKETSASTWFVRFKMDGFESESTVVDAADAAYFGTNRLPEGETVYYKPFSVTVNRQNLQCGYQAKKDTLKSMWEPGEWLNASLVRTYNEATNDYTFVYTVYNDSLQVLTSQTVQGALQTYGTEELSVFRHGEGGYSNTESYNGDTGLSVDDLRCYDLALTQDQIKNIISEEFSLDDRLLLHYNYEGTGDEVFADKATGTASEVKDNLQIAKSTGTDKEYGEYNVENGVITASDDIFAVYTAESTDTKKIYNENGTDPQCTWFVRFKSPEAHNYCALIDFRKPNSIFRPIYVGLNKNYQNPDIRFNNTAASNGNVSGWTRNEWVNLAIVRTYEYDLAESKYVWRYHTYYISADGTLTNVYDTYQLEAGCNWGGDIGFFRDFNDDSDCCDDMWSRAAGLSYDDIRCYNTALTPNQLSSLVVENFGANVVNKGLQIGVGTNDNTNQIRLIAQIKGSDYTAAGFKVTAAWDEQTGTPAEQDLPCTVAYSSVLMEQTIIVKENKMTFSGNYYPDENYYLIAVIVDNIPTGLTNLKLTFTPYATGDTEYTGETFTYNVSTGAYVQ